MSKPKAALAHTLVAGATVAASSPVLAHPGDHHGMTFGELAAHLASGWHLVVMALAAVVAVGVSIAIVGARREARARGRKQERRP